MNLHYFFYIGIFSSLLQFYQYTPNLIIELLLLKYISHYLILLGDKSRPVLENLVTETFQEMNFLLLLTCGTVANKSLL